MNDERIADYLRDLDDTAAMMADLGRDWYGDECPLCGQWLNVNRTTWRLVCLNCDVFYETRDERDMVAAQLATFYPEE